MIVYYHPAVLNENHWEISLSYGYFIFRLLLIRFLRLLVFQDIIEQVFHELGFGSVTTLHDFYHCRVLNYHRRMTETCQALVAEYNNLKLPIAAQPPVSKTHDSVAERETFNVIR